MNQRRRVLLRLSAVVLIVVGIILLKVEIRRVEARKARGRREIAYLASLHAYQQALKLGMTRKEVENHLRAKKLPLRQMCCVEAAELTQRSPLDDLTKIGDEKPPWFCNENNVYIAFQFVDHQQKDGNLLKASDLDTLKSITIYRWLEGCL
jgi:hypothetical protein